MRLRRERIFLTTDLTDGTDEAVGSGGLRDCVIAGWWEADIGDFRELIDVQVTLGAAKMKC